MDSQAFGLDEYRENQVLEIVIEHKELCPYAISMLKYRLFNTKRFDSQISYRDCTCNLWKYKVGDYVLIWAEDYEKLLEPRIGRIKEVDRCDPDLPYLIEYFVADEDNPEIEELADDWYPQSHLKIGDDLEDSYKIKFIEYRLES